MRTVLSISLPEGLAAELEKFARSTGRNKSDVVKESIAIHLWESRFEKTRRTLTRKAKKMGIVTEEDVFKEVS